MSNKKRILGIDVARALAIIGMIIVNFKIVFGSEGSPLLQAFVKLFEGKAAATFVVLAGVGIALMTRSAVVEDNGPKLQKAKLGISKRALLLFVIGLSYLSIWPADILHLYGVYMLITLFFLRSSPLLIFTTAMIFVFLYPILMFSIPYELGWDFETLDYEGFWTPFGFIRNLFYNGFHPVIPWTAFMLFGLWLGRQDLNDPKRVGILCRNSGIAFISLQLISYLLIRLLGEGDAQQIEELADLLGNSPMPPLPIYMLSGTSIAFFVITACILMAQKWQNSIVIQSLYKTGQLALTFYVVHVLIGMWLPELFSNKAFGEYSIEFSFFYALIFSFACILFAVIWLKYN